MTKTERAQWDKELGRMVRLMNSTLKGGDPFADEELLVDSFAMALEDSVKLGEIHLTAKYFLQRDSHFMPSTGEFLERCRIIRRGGADEHRFVLEDPRQHSPIRARIMACTTPEEIRALMNPKAVELLDSMYPVKWVKVDALRRLGHEELIP